MYFPECGSIGQVNQYWKKAVSNRKPDLPLVEIRKTNLLPRFMGGVHNEVVTLYKNVFPFIVAAQIFGI